MVNLTEFLEESGDLHDVAVLGIHLDMIKKSIRLDVKDFNVNFQGLPEYKGQASGSINLNGLNNVSIEMEAALDYSHIFSFLISKSDQENLFEMKFWPSGHIRGSYKDVIIEMEEV